MCFLPHRPAPVSFLTTLAFQTAYIHMYLLGMHYRPALFFVLPYAPIVVLCYLPKLILPPLLPPPLPPCREWAAVKVKPEDISLIVSELEVTEAIAEQTLKREGGNVVEALRRLLH